MIRMFFIVPLLVAVFLSSCENKKSGSGPVNSEAGLFVLNEGNFGTPNSSLDFYDTVVDTIYRNTFFNANGAALGDVANDLAVLDTFAVVAVNNSNSVTIVSTRSSALVGTIAVPQPRNVAVTPAGFAYVTSYNDFVTGRVFKIDPGSAMLDPVVIAVGDNPEGIAYFNGKLYVANGGFGFGSTVSVIDAGTDQVIGTITVRTNPGSIAIDEAEGQVYVSCQGRSWDVPPTEGGIMVIDATIDAVVDSITKTGFFPGDIRIADGRGVYIGGYSGPVQLFDAASHDSLGTISGNYFTAAVFPGNDRIFATDAADFLSDGSLVVFDENLQEIRRLTVGISPGTLVRIQN